MFKKSAESEESEALELSVTGVDERRIRVEPLAAVSPQTWLRNMLLFREIRNISKKFIKLEHENGNINFC